MLAHAKIENPALFCPFPSALNAHSVDAQWESVEWARRMRLIGSDAQFEKLDRSCIANLVSRAFPQANRAGLQIAADWTTLFCIADDFAEKLSDPDRVADYFFGLVTTFRSGETVDDQDPMARALLDLRSRMAALASEDWIFQFAEHIHDIFIGFSWEAVNRSRQVYCDPHDYFALRQVTVGLYPQFHLSVLTDGIDLPRECWEHPQIQRLMAATSNCVGWANDLFTYEKELQAGESHNLVFVLMQAEDVSLPMAVRLATSMHNQEVEDFIEMSKSLADFGEHDGEVRRFVAVLSSWIGGHLDWAQETGRYRPETVIDQTGELIELPARGWDQSLANCVGV